MMFWGVVLREVIGKVGFAGLPMDAEVALADTVAYPIETHVDCFRAALFDGIIDDAMGTGVIDLDGCWWLRPIHFFEGDAKRAGVLGVVEACANFCFCGRRKDVAQNAANNVNGAIKFWRWSIGSGRGKRTEEENATCARSGFGFGQVGCVTVDVKAHFAGVEAYRGVRM
jgi:hypothetical protein